MVKDSNNDRFGLNNELKQFVKDNKEFNFLQNQAYFDPDDPYYYNFCNNNNQLNEDENNFENNNINENGKEENNDNSNDNNNENEDIKEKDISNSEGDPERKDEKP